MNQQALKVLYQDDHLIAIDKPAGLLCHRSRIDKQATEFAVQMLRQQISRHVFLIHRLDRPTAGVLLFALDSQSARKLSEQMARHEIIKHYQAIVRGHPPNQGRWDEPLLEKPDRKTDRLAQKDKNPQPAITEFETTRKWEIPFRSGKYATSRYSEVWVRPLTGRRHQIRRHFNHMAHPIIGDTTHGDRRHNRSFRENLGITGLLLFARQIELRHPTRGDWLKIVAGPNQTLHDARQKLNEHALDPNETTPTPNTSA